MIQKPKGTYDVYGLTGTLLSNSPLDAYVPLKVVDGEKANYTNFKYRYCIYGGFGGYNIVKVFNSIEKESHNKNEVPKKSSINIDSKSTTLKKDDFVMFLVVPSYIVLITKIL